MAVQTQVLRGKPQVLLCKQNKTKNVCIPKIIVKGKKRVEKILNILHSLKNQHPVVKKKNWIKYCVHVKTVKVPKCQFRSVNFLWPAHMLKNVTGGGLRFLMIHQNHIHFKILHKVQKDPEYRI